MTVRAMYQEPSNRLFSTTLTPTRLMGGCWSPQLRAKSPRMASAGPRIIGRDRRDIAPPSERASTRLHGLLTATRAQIHRRRWRASEPDSRPSRRERERDVAAGVPWPDRVPKGG